METVGKDYSNRKSLDKFWPTFIPNPKIKNTYTKMMNSAMPKDIFAFMDEDNQVTDILRFSGLSTDPASANVEILASFGSLFTHVTVHQDRLICDKYVYDMSTWSELCELELKYNCMCISPMFHQIMLVGHDRYRQLSLLKWVPAATGGGSYQILQGNKNQISGPGAVNMAVTGLYKDVFAENCQTFIMTGG